MRGLNLAKPQPPHPNPSPPRTGERGFRDRLWAAGAPDGRRRDGCSPRKSRSSPSWPSSAAVALHAQGFGEAVVSLDALPLYPRVANAAVSYAAYLRQTFIPTDLAIFYSRPEEVSGGAVVALLLAISAAAVWFARALPYLFVGWFWFLGTLVPTIGLVQVGMQARADRYTYLPLVGIFLAVTWGLGDLLARLRLRRLGFAAAVLVLGLCGFLTRSQVGYWHDGVTLWEQALRVEPENVRARVSFGTALLDRGDAADALAVFDDLIRRQPKEPNHHHYRGEALRRLGRLDEAEAAYRTALALDPTLPRPHHGLTAVAWQREHPEQVPDGPK